MGVGTKEVLFLLQSIGVDVKSPQAALDESTVLAILQGKTHAPKQLIVRDTESRAFRPQKSALSRIKIVEKPAGTAASGRLELEPETPPPPPPARPIPAPPAPVEAKAKPVEPARTAVVPSEPEAEPAPPPKPPLPRKIALPPPRPNVGRPMGPSGPAAGARGAGAPRPTGPASGTPISRPMGPASGTPTGRPMGPASGSGRPGPSVYRPSPGGPGMRAAGMPQRPMGPGRPGPLGRPMGPGRAAAPPPVAERGPAKRKKEDEKDTKKPAAKRGAKPKITVADEVDLREFVGAYEEDTYSDISLPLIEKG